MSPTWPADDWRRLILPFPPLQTFDHLKESLCSYLETAYKIANRDVFDERAALLRKPAQGAAAPTVAQMPFIESTPAWGGTTYLAQLAQSLPGISPELSTLAGFGLPVADFPLYPHQQESLERAYSGTTPNLVVATGTGSGKTEIFLLAILADILREALTKPWPPLRPGLQPQPGTYDTNQDIWLHSRRHESPGRTPAVRAIVLYPMNALVNDQVQRLRRVLVSPASQAWQRAHLNGNLIQFGMYTGDTRPTGHPSNPNRRKDWNVDYQAIVATWNGLSQKNQDRGGWPRPDGPEMLCRWDMQAAPPDILVTNYSMLEYMLVRALESNIFDATKTWLHTQPGARLTLVLDEAHTYTGARGTEIAYLVRRLKERLGIRSGDGRLRCIATSASLPATAGAAREIQEFAAKLFGEGETTFWTVKTPPPPVPAPTAPTLDELRAFATFATVLDTENPGPAVDALLANLRLTPSNAAAQPEVRLFDALQGNPHVDRARSLTTRKAVPVADLSSDIWGAIGTPELRDTATAGVLAAGAMARAKPIPDAQPLISSRVHMFFRGVSGFWACMDPNCSQLPAGTAAGRPVGRLFTESTPWCACGSRVLELFSCRVCGLLYLGGIPDLATQSLWPWTSDLQSGRPDLNDFVIFGVEEPTPGAQASYRSTRTTEPANQSDPFTRPVYEVRPATTGGQTIPFPAQCPRCRNRRGRGLDGREIVEPLRTKGTKSFSALVEDAFRLQPATADSPTVNKGRKALTFADSRQDAAMLAGDLEIDHNRDLFRQMAYRILQTCGTCFGFGTVPAPPPTLLGTAGPAPQGPSFTNCATCGGTGAPAGNPAPIAVQDLRTRMQRFADRARINPTLDDIEKYFQQLTPFFNPNQQEAARHINAYLRDEISAPDFGLEPMGLATWRATFDATQLGNLPGLTTAESADLLEGVVRLLATEDVLLPPSLDLRDWGELVAIWDKKLLAAPGSPTTQQHVPFDPTGDRKLGRYLRAVANVLAGTGKISGPNAVDQWLAALAQQVFQALCSLGIIVSDAQGLGFGVNIDRFQLEPIQPQVYVCDSCAYVSNRAVLGVCLRCGQQASQRPATSLRNYYRRTVGFVGQPNVYPDPFLLRVFEHSAQIEKPEARRFELHFQDVFVGNEDPDDARIDVLSVTTTMEMGIDIGNLLSVGLRNVPPTVANYQQRAGRAGRRGSGVASVLAFAQNRSHDQYYFADPPRIVTDPPRIPRLDTNNPVIAERHVRALVLQRFFHQWPPTNAGNPVGGTLNAWGSVQTFRQNQGDSALASWVQSNRIPLTQRAQEILNPALSGNALAWVTAIPADVTRLQQGFRAYDDILGALLQVGYLPRHAFPIDVVSLWTEAPPIGANYDERGIQRDLGIGLSEFAPGAEIVRNKRIYRIAGLYDSRNQVTYQPGGQFVECRDCHAVVDLAINAPQPVVCPVCMGPRLSSLPYIRPPGFCADWAGPDAGGKKYVGGGRDRAGSASAARLAVGDDTFSAAGAYQPPFSPRLNVLVRTGDIYMSNRGPDPTTPGFRICPQCGRSLEPNQTSHTYPADIPPHAGPNMGPRAGTPCPINQPSQNRVLLAHRFPSEVILLGADLSARMDADDRQVSGHAVWLSFGYLLVNAAARVLNINPEELRAGVRPLRRPGARVHGEVFIYDTLPGGAGYARDTEANLEAILRQALADSRICTTPNCPGACYSCLLDYQNQPFHALLDRALGGAILDYVLTGVEPSLSTARMDAAAGYLLPYLPTAWATLPARTVAGTYVPLVLQDSAGNQTGLLVHHAAQAAPDAQVRQDLLINGLRPCPFTDFDLARRPFWVVNEIAK